jgi:hypothetical protein
MYPARILSLSNGWSILSQQKPQELQEIYDTIEYLTKEIVDNPLPTFIELIPDGVKSSGDIPNGETRFLGSICFAKLESKGWNHSNFTLNKTNGFRVFTSNVKNKVVIETIFNYWGQPSKLLHTLNTNIPLLHRINICDVYVILVPTDELLERYPDKPDTHLQGAMSMFNIFKESDCRLCLQEYADLTYSKPTVIMFISPIQQQFTIEEYSVGTTQSGVINRSIEFTPEYYQAGVGVLSYFGKVLRQKHPDINAKIRIEQDGTVVRMRIESPAGDHIETVEKELTQYALAIQGKILPEDIFENPLDALELKNKFEMAQLEVRQTRELLHYTLTQSEKRITSLEEDVAFLRQTIGSQLMHSNTLAGVVVQQGLSHDKLQSMQIGHAQGLFKDLLGEAHGNQIVLNAIKSLEKILLSGLATIDIQEQLKESLAIVHQSSPSLVSRVAAQIESAGYGALAGPALEWLKQYTQ